MPRWWLRTAIVAVFFGDGKAIAQQPVPAAGFPLELGLPPADTGEPRFSPTLSNPLPASDCAAALGCRLRVIGTVQHNGAVGLNAALFKW